MMGHKICCFGEIWLIIPKLSLFPPLFWSTDYYSQQQIARLQAFRGKVSSLILFGCKMTHFNCNTSMFSADRKNIDPEFCICCYNKCSSHEHRVIN